MGKAEKSRGFQAKYTMCNALSEMVGQGFSNICIMFFFLSPSKILLYSLLKSSFNLFILTIFGYKSIHREQLAIYGQCLFLRQSKYRPKYFAQDFNLLPCSVSSACDIQYIRIPSLILSHFPLWHAY